MKVVILCGGKGTRLSTKGEVVAKPLVEIGGMPILWHVIKGYAHYGFREFILCLGYGGEAIRAYVESRVADVSADWAIDCVDTGLDTNTGGRIKRIERMIRDHTFFVTYADGVADINILRLLEFHRGHGRIGTMTTVNPISQFGEVMMDGAGLVKEFVEKPPLHRWINGGFFVFDRGFFRYLRDDSVLEREPLESLVRDQQLYSFRHTGFWCCMDTYKDTIALNELCRNGAPPWGVWAK